MYHRHIIILYHRHKDYTTAINYIVQPLQTLRQARYYTGPHHKHIIMLCHRLMSILYHRHVIILYHRHMIIRHYRLVIILHQRNTVCITCTHLHCMYHKAHVFLQRLEGSTRALQKISTEAMQPVRLTVGLSDRPWACQTDRGPVRLTVCCVAQRQRAQQ